mgnify:FL=1
MKLYINCTVYASFRPLRRCRGLLVEGPYVRDLVGPSDAQRPPVLHGLEVIDLGGRVVMPGFIDAHAHLDGVGTALSCLNLRGLTSIQELGEALAAHKGLSGGWILGVGWDHEKFRERRMPTRWDLDGYVAEKPVLLVRVDGHSGVVNTRALELLALERLEEGVERDSGGSPTGVIKERALDFARERALEDRTLEEEKEVLLKAQAEFLRHGVTGIGFVSCGPRSLEALRALRREGRLKLRISAYLTPQAFDALGMADDDELLSVKGVKLFADGSFGSRTALLSSPYADDPGNFGLGVSSKEELIEYCLRARAKGLQAAIHAIGDRALDVVLEVYERCGARGQRIEHASLIRDDQYERIRRVGALLVVQPHFTVSDFWMERRLGPERARSVYPFARILREGLEQAFSTDAPVEPIDPWETVHAALKRGALAELTADQGLSLNEALYLYTEAAAKAIGRQDLGSLLPGKRADFIVLDRDPFEGELRGIKALKAYVGGEAVHEL